MAGLKLGRHPVLLVASVFSVSMTASAAQELRIVDPLSSILKPSQATEAVAPNDADKVRTQLAERGMQDIRNLRREGDVYRADASWYGEIVDVQVDAASGEVKQPTRLGTKQVEFLLHASGWHHIGQAERAGDTFSIRAQLGTKVFDLKIDARTGLIIECLETTPSQKGSLTSEGLRQR